ncbi:MAG: NAD(P)/FAD-dependent oxidoreductase [Candidatus Helarchaeota archaeon]
MNLKDIIHKTILKVGKKYFNHVELNQIDEEVNNVPKYIVIVGAGAAGLFAACKLTEKGLADTKITIIDQGPNALDRKCPLIKDYRRCARCKPCNMLSGVGGAGTYSSGLLNLNPKIGGDLIEIVGDERLANEFIQQVDDIFVKHGAPTKKYMPSPKNIEEIKAKAGLVGIKFIPSIQRHIGTENAPQIINNIQTYLEKQGVTFRVNTKVKRVETDHVVLDNDKIINFNYCLLAPGRVGMTWLANELQRLGVKTTYEPISIGVRVEVPSFIMESICSIERDPKFHIYPNTYDDFVRTFCVNHEGFVVMERYSDGSLATNGHSFITEKSSNSNFALLVQIRLTKPLEDTTAYGRAIAANCATLGGGKPIVQRLSDIRHGRRSKESKMKTNLVQPTLKNATPGDISMALPHRIFTDIIEAIEKLETIIPGVAAPSTLLYAPEIKYSAKKVETDPHLETAVENIFVAGDGAGLSRGIIGAAVTGFVAAEGILRKLQV